MMFTILFFSHKFIFSHLLQLSYIIFPSENKIYVRIDYVLGTNTHHPKAQYHNIIISVNETFILHWYRVGVYRTLGLPRLWHMRSTWLSASPIWTRSLASSVFCPCPDITHISPNYILLGRILYNLTQDIWEVHFYVYSTRRNKTQIF